MSYALEMLISAVLISSFYAVLASGFTMILGLSGVFNLAHGAYALIGAYIVLIMTKYLGLPTELAYPLAIIGGGLFSVLSYKGIIKRTIDDHIAVFMVTLIGAVCVEQVVSLFFTGSPRALKPIVDGNLTIMNVWVSGNMIFIFFTAWISVGALAWFMKYTHLGRGIIALSQDRKGAILCGVDSEKAYLVAFFIAGGLSAFAGALYGSNTMVYPHMWAYPLIISFVIVLLGGIGSILGTAVAACIVGFSETAVVYLVDPIYKEAVGLIIVIAVMILRPVGLFGHEEIE
ncbi:MAG: branched-chain amino acid ABC transporter permease [Deltaproteobacteria bacterium]|mgnify:CR=1 FL=1|nr:branched-chain amino acid ABC transporter permease [Deltaproteobacteria bacterium]MBT4644436.1 branched-chain amino acid ABC transporter permease [Deltaproteobacteria bacterium]